MDFPTARIGDFNKLLGVATLRKCFGELTGVFDCVPSVLIMVDVAFSSSSPSDLGRFLDELQPKIFKTLSIIVQFDNNKFRFDNVFCL
jgi:hypothetical protein